MAFGKKATRTGVTLRMAIISPPGCGKSVSGLKILTYLLDGQGFIAAIDTENRSLSKYAPPDGVAADPEQNTFDFHVEELANFEPKRYVQLITEAIRAGASALLIDSLSHAWMGKGGILEQLDKKGSKFGAWKDLTPQQTELMEALIRAPMHEIVTLRTKMAYEVETEGGKVSPKKLGLAPVQREGMEYEFDVVMEMDENHVGRITKTRCSAIAGRTFREPGEELAKILREWLALGKPVEATADEEEPAPEVAAPEPKKGPTPEAWLSSIAAADGRKLLGAAPKAVAVPPELRSVVWPAYAARWAELLAGYDDATFETVVARLAAEIPAEMRADDAWAPVQALLIERDPKRANGASA